MKLLSALFVCVATILVSSAADSKPMKDSTPTAAAAEKIVLGGGCFWCVEAVYQRLEGVKSVESGYAGGQNATIK